MSLQIPDCKGVETEAGSGVSVLNEPVMICNGSGNRLILGEDSSVGAPGKRVKFEFLGSGNTFVLGANCYLKRGHYMFNGDNMTISIGANTSINGAYIICLEGSSVFIGEDCMLAHEIEIRTSDAHSIIDIDTGERVNQASDVVIEDAVWVGKGAMFMPGTRMSKGSIVGARSLITNIFEEPNIVIAGVPGRIVSHRRSWDRRRL